jgi:hypothetical protein
MLRLRKTWKQGARPRVSAREAYPRRLKHNTVAEGEIASSRCCRRWCRRSTCRSASRSDRAVPAPTATRHRDRSACRVRAHRTRFRCRRMVPVLGDIRAAAATVCAAASADHCPRAARKCVCRIDISTSSGPRCCSAHSGLCPDRTPLHPHPDRGEGVGHRARCMGDIG